MTLNCLNSTKIIVSASTQEFDSILDIVMNRTGLNFYYNYLLSEQPEDFTYYPQWLEKPQVRKAIHVGNLTYDDVSMKVHQYLNDDMLKSIRPWLEALLEADYKVLNNYFALIVAIKSNRAFSLIIFWPSLTLRKEKKLFAFYHKRL